MKTSYSLFLSIFTLSLSWAQNMLIISGTDLSMKGSSAEMVLNNAQFINDGTFTAGVGTVILAGNSTDSQSAISGTSNTTFYNLRINKSVNGVQLQQAIQIDHELQMLSGDLDLNGHNLTLNTALPAIDGTIIGESGSSRIIGPAGGEVIKTLELNAPAGINPGNIGIVLTTADDLGTTDIRRGHVPETIDANVSIARYYSLLPTNNSGLNVMLQLQYFDEELNGNTGTELGPYRNDGTYWFNAGTTATDPTSNFVETSNVNLLSNWTLAPDAPKLNLKVFLQGPYAAGSMDMKDDLRALDLLPLEEPYGPSGYDHIKSGGGESVAAPILDIAAAESIVDWVLVELRDAGDASIVVAVRSALLQRDGDIVDLDGISALSFPGLAKGGSYYIAVRHRNHLGVMTAGPVVLN